MKTVCYSKEEFISRIPSPAIVISSDLNSRIASIIRRRTDGGWSHAMINTDGNILVSQEWKVKTYGLEEFFDKNPKSRVQAIWNPLWDEHQKFAILRRAKEDIDNRGSYDVLGIIGQLLGVRWFNFGNWEYCSEQVINCIKAGDHSPVWISTREKIRDISPQFDEDHYNPEEIHILGEVLNWDSLTYDPTI